MHSVNICFKMKKIKNKIYEGYIYGKFDLDDISKIFGFDKDYLIKMKEEMNFLKDGKIKSYFNIGSNPDPFLTKASENRNNANNDFAQNLIPMSKELEESIKQCNYFIYQDLIYYQTNNNRINNFMFNQGAYDTKNNNNLKDIYNEAQTEEENNADSIQNKEDNIINKENNYEINNQKFFSDR